MTHGSKAKVIMRTIDFNCDLGESFGPWPMGADAAVMPFISSANIACGFHAGDPQTMLHTIQLAKRNSIAIGAHTGLPDKVGFGRREMHITPDELYADTAYQLGALLGCARTQGLAIAHVKPHGALYHMIERRSELAESYVKAITDFDPTLIVVGLARGKLVQTARQSKLVAADEVFADRAYQTDGSLVPRGKPGAVIDDPDQAADGLLERLAQADFPADTVCIHGDRNQAGSFAAQIASRITAAGYQIARLKT